MAEDFSETDDLAAGGARAAGGAGRPLWWEEAERNDVLPLDNRVLWALINKPPDHRRDRPVFRYFPGGAPVPEPVAVNVRNRSHTVQGRRRASATGSVADGVLVGPRLGPRRLVAARPRRPSRATCTTSTARTRHVLDRPRAARRPGAHQVALRVHQGRAASAGRPSCWWTARWWPRGRSPASPRPASTAWGWG